MRGTMLANRRVFTFIVGIIIMGIRFYCPNGHKLNVKEFQAGQRGICPKCHAKFDIPFESTRPAGSKDLPIAREWEERARREGLYPFTKKEGMEITDINLNAISADMDTVPGFDAYASGKSTIISTATPEDMAPRQTQSNATQNPFFAIQEQTANQTATPQPAMPPIQQAPRLPDPFEGAPDLVWYVRPTSGEQLGPVDRDIMRRWLSENRIAADTLVWKEGWADWKVASDVFESLASQKNIFGF